MCNSRPPTLLKLWKATGPNACGTSTACRGPPSRETDTHGHRSGRLTPQILTGHRSNGSQTTGLTVDIDSVCVRLCIPEQTDTFSAVLTLHGGEPRAPGRGGDRLCGLLMSLIRLMGKTWSAVTQTCYPHPSTLLCCGI